MSLRDHPDMAYAMNSIATHSQFVDDLDEVIFKLHTAYSRLRTLVMSVCCVFLFIFRYSKHLEILHLLRKYMLMVGTIKVVGNLM